MTPPAGLAGGTFALAAPGRSAPAPSRSARFGPAATGVLQSTLGNLPELFGDRASRHAVAISAVGAAILLSVCAVWLWSIATWQITGDGEAVAYEGWALVAPYGVLATPTWFE